MVGFVVPLRISRGTLSFGFYKADSEPPGA
jgi:hypothetical protein